MPCPLPTLLQQAYLSSCVLQCGQKGTKLSLLITKRRHERVPHGTHQSVPMLSSSPARVCFPSAGSSPWWQGISLLFRQSLCTPKPFQPLLPAVGDCSAHKKNRVFLCLIISLVAQAVIVGRILFYFICVQKLSMPDIQPQRTVWEPWSSEHFAMLPTLSVPKGEAGWAFELFSSLACNERDSLAPLASKAAGSFLSANRKGRDSSCWTLP